MCVTQVVLACLLPGRPGLCVRLRPELQLPRQPTSTKPLTPAKTRTTHHTTTARPHHNTILSHASPAIAQGSIISYQHPPNVRLPSPPPHRPHRCKTLSAKSNVPQPWTTTTATMMAYRRVVVGMPGNAMDLESL